MSRRRLVLLARVVFLVAVAVGAYVALRGHGREVLEAAGATRAGALAAAGGLVLVGLGLTSVAWRRVLAGFGHPLPVLEGSAVFFVGQLGKYVPGGVWSIGAHAHLAAAHAVPARVTASASLVFLGLNVATSALVAGLSATVVASDPRSGSSGPMWPGPVWLGPGLVLLGLIALHPRVVTRGAGLVAGRTGTLVLSVPAVARLAGLLGTTWLCYGGAAAILLPDPSGSLLALTTGAMALSYAVGVAVVLAPAGLGAREVTLVALLAPAVGLGPAGAVAVLTRVLHTAADLLLAVAAAGAVRARAVGPRPAAGPGAKNETSRPPAVAEPTPRVRPRFSPPA